MALVLGSGLGGLTGRLAVERSFEYGRLPHMPKSTAPGHSGTLVLGTLAGVPVAVFSGRFHYYEGYTAADVVYPIRVAWGLGVEAVCLTSIVGSMNPAMPPGSLALIQDHINLMGVNPLLGPNDEQMGPRFPDMSDPYDHELARFANDVAQAQGLPLHPAVYVAVPGPNLETRAEYRFLRQIGADIVGMSTVPEVIAARHLGLRVLAVSIVSDACLPDQLKPALLEELLRVAAETEPKLSRLLEGVVRRVGTTRAGRREA